MNGYVKGARVENSISTYTRVYSIFTCMYKDIKVVNIVQSASVKSQTVGIEV